MMRALVGKTIYFILNGGAIPRTYASNVSRKHWREVNVVVYEVVAFLICSNRVTRVVDGVKLLCEVRKGNGAFVPVFCFCF